MHILYFLSSANRSIGHITVYRHVQNVLIRIQLPQLRRYCESAPRRRAVSHITQRSFVSFRRDGIIIVLYVIIHNNIIMYIMISYLFKLRNRVLKSINLNPSLMKIFKLENDFPCNLDNNTRQIQNRYINILSNYKSFGIK